MNPSIMRKLPEHCSEHHLKSDRYTPTTHLENTHHRMGEPFSVLHCNTYNKTKIRRKHRSCIYNIYIMCIGRYCIDFTDIFLLFYSLI